jgi:hypothetical protein
VGRREGRGSGGRKGQELGGLREACATLSHTFASSLDNEALKTEKLNKNLKVIVLSISDVPGLEHDPLCWGERSCVL